MADPEVLLQRLPEESPPPEIVMAALRVFRYRAIAAVLLAVALVVSAILVKSQLDANSRLQQKIAAARYTEGVISVSDIHDVDGANLMLYEIVRGDDQEAFVHIIAWDPQGRPFTPTIVDPMVNDEPAELGEIESSGGGSRLTTVDLWQEISWSKHADRSRLTFDLEIEGRGISGTTTFTTRI